MDNLPIYLPLKMELNEGITRLAHFGKPQKKQATLMDNLPIFVPSKGYNASYFGDCRRVIKRSILDVCEHFAPEQDTKRAVLDTFD